MELNDYQDKAEEFAKAGIKGDLTYLTLGLCGEAGEVAEKVKKYKRDGYLNNLDVVRELGDVLWYLANLATALGTPMSEVAESNIDKLSSRKKRGKIGGSGDNR